MCKYCKYVEGDNIKIDEVNDNSIGVLKGDIYPFTF